MGQQVRDEPVKPVGLADCAERNLEVGDAPRSLELAPGERETHAVRGGLAPPSEHARPEVVDERVGDRASASDLAHPVGERRKLVFFEDRRVFKGSLAAPAVEIDARQADGSRQRRLARRSTTTWGCRYRRSGSGRRRHWSAAIPAADEVLDPDAGMEQLGLMPGDDQGTFTGSD